MIGWNTCPDCGARFDYGADHSCPIIPNPSPGPWTFADGANSHVFDIRIESASNGCIAFTDREHAHLIAAAPELLKALESIAEMLNLDNESSYAADDREGAIDAAFGTARKAIAKAKGE